MATIELKRVLNGCPSCGARLFKFTRPNTRRPAFYCLSRCNGRVVEGEIVATPNKEMREVIKLLEERLGSLPQLVNSEYEELWKNPSGAGLPEKRQLKFYKHVWREQVLADSELGYQARVVAFWLADWIDKRDGVEHFIRTKKEIVVFPGQSKLAQKVGCAQSEVSRSLKAICEQWHMVRVQRNLAKRSETKSGADLPAPNEYVLILEPNRAKRRRLSEKVDRLPLKV